MIKTRPSALYIKVLQIGDLKISINYNCLLYIPYAA